MLLNVVVAVLLDEVSRHRVSCELDGRSQHEVEQKGGIRRQIDLRDRWHEGGFLEEDKNEGGKEARESQSIAQVLQVKEEAED